MNLEPCSHCEKDFDTDLDELNYISVVAKPPLVSGYELVDLQLCEECYDKYMNS